MFPQMTDHLTKNGGGVWYKNKPPNILGESPIYRSIDSTLHWTDVHATPCTIQILKIDPFTGNALEGGSGSARILEVPFNPITAIYFRRDVRGSYICGYRQGIAFLDEQTGEVEVLKKLIGDEELGLTVNDGGIDPKGRFWVGSVDLDALVKQQIGGGRGEQKPRGKLWRYEADGCCTVMENGIMISNGIGWSPDGKYSELITLGNWNNGVAAGSFPAIPFPEHSLSQEKKLIFRYLVFYNDSGPQIVWKYDFDVNTGNISNRRKIIDGGLPKGVMNDGMVIE